MESTAVAMDLGSNLARVAMGTLDPTGYPQIVHKDVEVVRLAAGMGASESVIARGAIDRAVAAIGKLMAGCGAVDPSKVACVGTGALRMAANREQVRRAIFSATGVEVRVIDGTREARLSLLGVRTQIRRDRIVLLDIGGASTEAVFLDRTIRYARSFDVGVITLTEGVPDGAGRDRVMRRRAREALAGLPRAPAWDSQPPSVLSAGGAAVALSAWRSGESYLHYRGDGRETLSRQERRHIYRDFLSRTESERARRLRISESHAALVPAGYAILEAALSRLGVDRVTPTGCGVVEGLVAECLGHEA